MTEEKYVNSLKERCKNSYLHWLSFQVLSFLDQNSLCLSAMVCRQWHMASLHQEFWQSLSFVGEHVTGEKGMHVCHVASLTVHICAIFSLSPLQIICEICQLVGFV
jgi:hypothetical protein